MMLQPGVCVGRSPAEASRELIRQLNDISSLLRKGNYSKIAKSITSIETVQDEALTSSSITPFRLFESSAPSDQQGSPIAHETLVYSEEPSSPIECCSRLLANPDLSRIFARCAAHHTTVFQPSRLDTQRHGIFIAIASKESGG